MSMIANLIVVAILCYCSFKFGQSVTRVATGDTAIRALADRAKFPAVVAEKIDGHYYLYEKDSVNFLCQAPTLEELPKKLLENKKISLAVLVCPEESPSQIYWCLNGKLKTVNI